jgi:hypothetical protein
MRAVDLASVNIDEIDLEQVDEEGGSLRPITDLDLPPECRTQANFWKAKYFESYKELVNANKGLRRLKRRTEYLQGHLLTVGSILKRHDQAEKAKEAKADEQI